MSLLSILVGLALVAFTVQEVFQDLFHPSGSGTVSDYVARRLFSFFRCGNV
jgi:hypothetical protein